jgi:protein gp37
MSDLFHVDVPESFIRQCFEVMLETERHIYQILTKRPGRARRFIERNADLFGAGLPSHIWIGTSVEEQSVDYRVGQLLRIPATVRFLSCEPLIGSLSIAKLLSPQEPGIHWVIVGGESGLASRPMEASWPRNLRDECQHLNIPFFFKQWGGRTPKAGGRDLDGRNWDEFPQRH